MNATPRPNTPDVVTYDEQGRKSTRITTKRACNGCGQFVGDITAQVMSAAINGRPLPDVRQECPACAPTAPPPVCQALTLVTGEMDCLGGDCPHGASTADGACHELRTEVFCATHSVFTDFEGDDAYEVATHAEPWPCQYDAAQPPADDSSSGSPQHSGLTHEGSATDGE